MDEELAQEELRSSLKSVLSLIKLPSLSALRRWPRCSLSSSISTIIVGRGTWAADVGEVLALVGLAAVLAGGGGAGRPDGISRESDL